MDDFSIKLMNQSDVQFDGSLIIELFTIIRYWKLAVADTSYLRVDNQRYHEFGIQSWGCAVAKDPQLLCLDIASARTFGTGKTIVGWKDIDPNVGGSLSNCNPDVAGGSGFNGTNTGCEYTADNSTDITRSEFFRKIIIDMDERNKLVEAYNNWVTDPQNKHDPRFGGYECGLSSSASAIERFNDGIVDVFDMTMIAYIIFNIPPFETVRSLVEQKTPIPAAYMSNSIQDHYMLPYQYDEGGFGICGHLPLGRRSGSTTPDAGMHFYNHFARLNINGDACPDSSPGRALMTGTGRRLSKEEEEKMEARAKALVDVNSPYHRRLQTDEDAFPLTSFVMFLWSRVPDTLEDGPGGSWYQIAFAPGITPLVIQFYFDGLDAGSTTSQIVNTRTTAQNVKERPLNPSRINVRWVSYERSNPELYTDLPECYPITSAVDSQYAVYKNALAIRQIGTPSQRPCSFDLYIWIPSAMHTDTPRQTGGRRRAQEDGTDLTTAEPCLRSLRDPATGLCEPVVHIRPGSQFSTPGGFFALDKEMSALEPRQSTTTSTATFGGSVATISATSIDEEQTSDGWWIWFVVGLSIVLVLCFLAIACGIIAYGRHMPDRNPRARTSDIQSTKVNVARPSSGSSRASSRAGMRR